MTGTIIKSDGAASQVLSTGDLVTIDSTTEAITKVDAKKEGVPAVILPKERDPRFITIHRGGTLTDADHQLLALRWQRDQLPEAIRALVLDDQRVRNDLCWSVFDC